MGTAFDFDASFRLHISCPLFLATTSAHYRYDHNYTRKLGCLLFVGYCEQVETYTYEYKINAKDKIKLRNQCDSDLLTVVSCDVIIRQRTLSHVPSNLITIFISVNYV